MSTTSTCANCGAEIAGRFCSQCGTPVTVGAAADSGAISHLLGEVTNSGHIGFLGTLWQILKSPVNATLRLVDDPTYSGYKTFFVTATAMSVAVSTLVFQAQPIDPATPEPLRQLIEAYGNYHGLTLSLLQYASVVIGFLLGYWIIKPFAKNKRPAREYFKLTCLTAGFGALLNILITLPQLLMEQEPDPSDPMSLPLAITILVVILGTALFLIYYSMRVQLRFWNLTFWRLVLASILIGLAMLGIMAILGVGAGIVVTALIPPPT